MKVKLRILRKLLGPFIYHNPSLSLSLVLGFGVLTFSYGLSHYISFQLKGFATNTERMFENIILIRWSLAKLISESSMKEIVEQLETEGYEFKWSPLILRLIDREALVIIGMPRFILGINASTFQYISVKIFEEQLNLQNGRAFIGYNLDVDELQEMRELKLELCRLPPTATPLDNAVVIDLDLARDLTGMEKFVNYLLIVSPDNQYQKILKELRARSDLKVISFREVRRAVKRVSELWHTLELTLNITVNLLTLALIYFTVNLMYTRRLPEIKLKLMIGISPLQLCLEMMSDIAKLFILGESIGLCSLFVLILSHILPVKLGIISYLNVEIIVKLVISLTWKLAVILLISSLPSYTKIQALTLSCEDIEP